MAPGFGLQGGAGVATRSKTNLSGYQGGLSLRMSNINTNAKRKQENSPPKGGKPTLKRRPALGELTNAAGLKSTILKKGSSNTDLLKPVSNFTVHQDIVKPKTRQSQVNTTTTTVNNNTKLTNNTKCVLGNTTKTKINVPSGTLKKPTISTLNKVRTVVHMDQSTTTTTTKPPFNTYPTLVTKPVTKRVTSQTKKSSLNNKTINKSTTTTTTKNKSKTSLKTTETKQSKDTSIPSAPQEHINIRRESLRSHRRSSATKSDESSLYVSALEDLDVTNSNKLKKSLSYKKQSLNSEKKENSLIAHFDNEFKIKDEIKIVERPSDVEDFDKESWDDPLQVSCYAMHIFEYLKSKENEYKVKDYMGFQQTAGKNKINAEMRAVLIDWMVEIQETFELNHETLYLAVKLVDLSLTKMICSRESLQLLGAVAIFVASKFDDRIPPQLSDLDYICSNAYSIQDFKDMEIKLVVSVDFNLGAPLSYRFLRRYARCNKIQLPLLTLARYILELSLMEYTFISESESKMACASLYLARRMSNLKDPWNKTLEYYSGYSLSEIKSIVIELNRLLVGQPRTVMMQSLATVYNKYSHSIFFEVAKTPLVKEKDLFLKEELIV